MKTVCLAVILVTVMIMYTSAITLEEAGYATPDPNFDCGDLVCVHGTLERKVQGTQTYCLCRCEGDYTGRECELFRPAGMRT